MHDLKTESTIATEPLSVRIAGWIVQIFPRLLGSLFLFTAIQKIRDPQPLHAVFSFDGLPESVIQIASWGVIAIEIALGAALLIFLRMRRIILLATAVLLVIYIAQLGYLLIYDQAPSCGCLGADASPNETRTTNLISLVRNLCLLWPVIWTWRQLSLARKKL